MDMSIGDLLDLTLKFGLPLILFYGVVWLSMTGKVVWRPSHDAIVTVLTERLKDVTSERDRFAEIAYKGVSAVEQGAEALKGSRR